MTAIIASITATLPIIAVVLYFSLEKELTNNTIIVWKLFIAGCVSTFVIGIIHSLLSVFVAFPDKYNLLSVPYFALTEESCKFILIYFFLRKNIEKYSLKNLFFLGTVVALGFAALENISYVTGDYIEIWLSVSIGRILFSVPMHAITGGIIGMFIFIYLKCGREIENIVYGLGLGIFIHALFNVFAIQEGLFGTVSILLIIVGEVIIAIYLYKKLLLFKSDIKTTSETPPLDEMEHAPLAKSKGEESESFKIISKENEKKPKDKERFQVISRKKK